MRSPINKLLSFRRTPGPLFVVIGCAGIFLTSFTFFRSHALYWDNLALFSLYRDYFQSINHFNEFVQWLPQYQGGWPGSYYIILGYHGITPLILLEGAAVWATGILGVDITYYFYVYLFHYGILIPALFLTSIVLIVRRVFPGDAATQLYVFSVASLSPGMVLNLSDIGALERLAYGLYFLHALMICDAQNSRWWWTYFMACWFGVLLSVGFLSPLMLSLLGPLIVSGAIVSKGMRTNFANKVRALNTKLLAVLIFGSLVSVAPHLLVQQVSGELDVGRTGSDYDLSAFVPGNPLEAMEVGVPHVGFEWYPAYRHEWKRMGSFTLRTTYNYLGGLALPLAAVAVLGGSSNVLTLCLLGSLTIQLFILIKGNQSIIFEWMIRAGTPFDLFNHFNDFAWRGGAYLLLLFLAGIGMRSIVEARRAANVVVAFPLILTVSIWHAGSVSSQLNNLSIGDLRLALPIVFATCAGALLMLRKLSQISPGLLSALLISVTCADCAYVLNAYLSNVLQFPEYFDEVPAADGVGLQLGDGHPFYPAEGVIVKGRSVRPQEKREPEVVSARGAPLEGSSVAVVSKTFNQLVLSVRTPEAAAVSIPDTYSRFWKASVNGTAAVVVETATIGKEVFVAKGSSVVKLEFSIPLLSHALLLVHLCYLLHLGVFVVISRGKQGGPGTSSARAFQNVDGEDAAQEIGPRIG